MARIRPVARCTACGRLSTDLSRLDYKARCSCGGEYESMMNRWEKECEKCDGEGKINGNDCAECYGVGWIERTA
jgi:DnaJ-class molecular chaperone